MDTFDSFMSVDICPPRAHGAHILMLSTPPLNPTTVICSELSAL